MPGQPLDTQRAFELLRGVRDGTVHGRSRRREAQQILSYWPWDLIEKWARTGGTWHALLEAPRWTDVAPEGMRAFCSDYVEQHGRWPSVGTLRRLAGRTTNHRRPGEGEGQEALSV